ncbi:uncharacterized protein [Medicago truncatula]|nr:uncharacterized protein LOC25490554 [Medicago truncatula]XP_039688358.1 uncharacterized protein LOC25490554 [Medicago truncatula]
MFVGLGKFAMVLKDMFGKVIKPSVFVPPMHFVVDRINVAPTFNNNLPPLTANLSFRHDNNNFAVNMMKKLTENDVSKGFLVLHFGHFVDQAFDKARTNLKLLDECGNSWQCVLVFASASYGQCVLVFDVNVT